MCRKCGNMGHLARFCRSSKFSHINSDTDTKMSVSNPGMEKSWGYSGSSRNFTKGQESSVWAEAA